MASVSLKLPSTKEVKKNFSCVNCWKPQEPVSSHIFDISLRSFFLS